MKRRPSGLILFVLLWLLFLPAALFAQMPAARRLTVDDVIRMSRAGAGEDVILEQIERQGVRADLTTEQILQLKSAAVSDRVVLAMMTARSGDAAEQGSGTSPATLSTRTAPELASTGFGAPSGWASHTDPSGFVVAVPPGWTIRTDRQFGRTTLQGTQDERVVIWPMLVEGGSLDAQGAAVLLRQLARQVDPATSWSAPEISPGAVRVIGLGGDKDGVTLMTWTSAPAGASVCLYLLQAPAGVYRTSRDTFHAILRSYRTRNGDRWEEGTSRGGFAGPGNLSWTEPQEGAFTVSVPPGWKVTGGMNRVTATDVRMSLSLQSPDHQIRIRVGDPKIGGFIQPTPLPSDSGLPARSAFSARERRPTGAPELAFANTGQGGVQTLIDGTRLEVRSFVPGLQFAREYVERTVWRECAGLDIRANRERQDLIPAFDEQIDADRLAGGQFSMGDVTFTCSLRGSEMRGYYAAVTVMPLPGKAPWWVYRIYGYLAPASRQREAENVAWKVLQSWSVNPEWRAKEKEIAAAAVPGMELTPQPARVWAPRPGGQDQDEAWQFASRGYPRQRIPWEETSRNQENAMPGTMDIVDPATNRQYKIAYTGSYRERDYPNNIGGRQTGGEPSGGWRPLIDLP